MSFLNKVMIVTGGSSGIGAATAILFAKEGADVAIVGRNEANLSKVATEINKHNRRVLALKADVNKDEDVRKIVEKTIKKFGKIDVLVNNAGITNVTEIEDNKFVEAYENVMNTNLRAIVLLTHLIVPYLKKTKGNIVNVSSIGGESNLGDGGFGFSLYCASKAAVNLFSEHCAMSLAEYGVRVNIVSPGPANTNLFEAAGFGFFDLSKAAEKTTALRTLIEPEEVANVIAFLASDKAKNVTGSNYRIDAGYLIKGSRKQNKVILGI